MSASVPTLFTETTLDGFPLWVVLLICGGVFLAGFMDAIAGGGGIISVPVYLMAFSGLPRGTFSGGCSCLPPGWRWQAPSAGPSCSFTRRMWC